MMKRLCCLTLVLFFVLEPVSPCADDPSFTCSLMVNYAIRSACYDVNFKTICCATCKSFAVSTPGCEYGDIRVDCWSLSCNDPLNAIPCCDTCARPPTTSTTLSATTSPPITTKTTTTTTPTTTTSTAITPPTPPPTTPTTTTTTPTTTPLTTTPSTTAHTPTQTTTPTTTTTPTPTPTPTTPPTKTTTTTTPITTTTTTTTHTTTEGLQHLSSTQEISGKDLLYITACSTIGIVFLLVAIGVAVYAMRCLHRRTNRKTRHRSSSKRPHHSFEQRYKEYPVNRSPEMNGHRSNNSRLPFHSNHTWRNGFIQNDASSYIPYNPYINGHNSYLYDHNSWNMAPELSSLPYKMTFPDRSLSNRVTYPGYSEGDFTSHLESNAIYPSDVI